MADGIKKWKRCALSPQNYLTMKKTEVNHARILFQIDRWKEDGTMEGWMELSNAIVAFRL